MGFVTIEDIQGVIELVLFPKTWDKYRNQLKDGQIVIIEGKVDTGSTPPKILVDAIHTEIKVTSALDSQPAQILPATPIHYQSKSAPARKTNQPANVIPPAAPMPAFAESAPEYIPDDMPPPPDNFPDGWDMEWQPSFDEVEIASKPAPKFKKDEPITPPRAALPDAILAETIDDVTGDTTVMSYTVPSLYVPLAKAEADHPPKQITVVLRASDDKERDKRRIRTVHGTLTSFHGKDKFSFQIFESGKGHLIDFPNETTRITPELITRLHKILGEECWRVEEITFQ